MRPADAVPRRSARATARTIQDALDFIRVSALGATMLVALLGTASAPLGAPSIETFAAVAVIAILFHVFAYVLNDVVDLDLDRTEPRRGEMPLVTGAISPPVAAAIALGCVPLAGWLTFLVAPRPSVVPALASLALAFVGLAVYDLFGKRTSWPPVTDVIQGLGWAALLMGGAWIGGGVTTLTWALAAYVAVFIVMTNGVHGALRDLPNDQRHRTVTTASLLGARTTGDDRRIVSSALQAYAWILQGILIALMGLALAVDDAPALGRVLSAATALVLAATSVLLLAAASRRIGPRGEELNGPGGPDGDLLAAGMLHLLVGLAIPIATVAARIPLPIVAAMTAAYLVPVLAHGWLAGAGQWLRGASLEIVRKAGQRGRDLLLLTRPHNCLAAGLAVVVGAHLGGVTSLLSEPVARAGLLTFLVVAAADVANDRLDIAEDRVNRPERPIAAGRISPRLASVFAAGLAAAGVALGLTFGPVSGAVVLALTAASVAYSVWLKRTVLIGNAVVAALSSATIVYGALTLGRPTTAMAIGTGYVFLSVLTSEILHSVLDRDGDAAAGRRTIGTIVSLADGIHLHAALVLALMALVLLPPLTGVVPRAFLLAALAGVVVPNILVLFRMRGIHEARQLRRASPLSKLAWFTGLGALAFLA